MTNWIRDDAFACYVDLNPGLLHDYPIDVRVARLRDAQLGYGVGLAAKIPSVQTEILSLQIGDTCLYYPEDRCIAEKVRLGRGMVRAISS